MGRVWRFLAAWGLDILLVLAAAASAVGTLLRNDSDLRLAGLFAI